MPEILHIEVAWNGSVGERLHMSDGSVWFHPYSGGRPVRERAPFRG